MSADHFILIPNARHQSRPPDLPLRAHSATPNSTPELHRQASNSRANQVWQAPPPPIPNGIKRAFASGKSESSSVREGSEDSARTSHSSSEGSDSSSINIVGYQRDLRALSAERTERTVSLAPAFITERNSGCPPIAPGQTAPSAPT